MKAKLMRIGLYGASSSHSLHFLETLNASAAFPGIRITAIHGPDDPTLAENLAERFGLQLAQDQEELFKQVDALAITMRQGSEHEPIVRACLLLGLPLFVDKPFAGSVQAAEQLIDLAERRHALVCGGSSLPLLLQQQHVADTLRRASHLVIAFSASERSPYGGYAFHGAHASELCVSLLGANWHHVHAFRHGDGIVAQISYDTRQAVIINSPNENQLRIAYSGPEGAGIIIPEMSYEPLAAMEFGKMLKTSQLPRPLSYYLQSMQLTEEILNKLKTHR